MRDDAAIAADGARFADLVGEAGSTVQVLVTDDRQNEIEEALVRAIDGAKTRIRLEHAYFTHDRVLDALHRALARGVDLDVIIPEASGGVFYGGNRAEAVALLEAAAEPGAGKLEVTFFQQNGDYFFHNHTKALVADDRELIVGSGNLDQRGMAGTFASDGARLLFNRELDYRITDPAYVARFEREIFDRDKAAGEGKPLLAKVAEGWAFGAIGEAWEPFVQRFHGGKPVAETVAALAKELGDGAASALAEARKRTGTPATGDRAALDAQAGRLAALGDRLGVLGADLARDARAMGPEALATRLTAESDAIAAGLPAGRVRDIATKAMAESRAQFLKALADTPAPGYPGWFAERLLATHALWGARAATLATRDRLAGVMAEAPPTAFDAEIRRVLVPDAKQAAVAEVLDLLF
jgi:hypothetical protein